MGCQRFFLFFFMHKSCHLKCQTDQSEAREPNGEKSRDQSQARKTEKPGWLVGRAMALVVPVVLSREGSNVDLTFFHPPHATRTATSSGAYHHAWFSFNFRSQGAVCTRDGILGRARFIAEYLYSTAKAKLLPKLFDNGYGGVLRALGLHIMLRSKWSSNPHFPSTGAVIFAGNISSVSHIQCKSPYNLVTNR